MEKSTFKAIGKGLKQEFKLPEDLPFLLRKALEELAKLPREPEEESGQETTTSSHWWHR